MRTAAAVLVALATATLAGRAAPAPPAPSAISAAFVARAVQPGELVVATIATREPADHVRVHAFNHDIEPFRLDALRWRALIGIDLETKPGGYLVSIDADGGPAGASIAGGSRHLSHRLVVLAKKFPTRHLSVDDAFVNPPDAALTRITDDAKTLAAVWDASSPSRLWDGPFVRPVPQAANSAFGTRSVFNGEARAPHSGADFPSPAGTPVAAPNAGRIVLAKDLYYTGNTVVIDHGLGLFSLFAHLSVTDVRVGDTVRSGQIIGKVGATGRVTGPHLHWMVRVENARVDPLSVLAELGAPASPR